MIDGSTMKVGGRPLKHWIGTKLQSWGAKIANKNKHIMVTNPSCKLFNPFTLVVNFTVDTNDKYQVVIQGDYKKIYKESVEDIPELTEREMFMIIAENKREWFKKE